MVAEATMDVNMTPSCSTTMNSNMTPGAAWMTDIHTTFCSNIIYGNCSRTMNLDMNPAASMSMGMNIHLAALQVMHINMASGGSLGLRHQHTSAWTYLSISPPSVLHSFILFTFPSQCIYLHTTLHKNTHRQDSLVCLRLLILKHHKYQTINDTADFDNEWLFHASWSVSAHWLLFKVQQLVDGVGVGVDWLEVLIWDWVAAGLVRPPYAVTGFWVHPFIYWFLFFKTGFLV